MMVTRKIAYTLYCLLFCITSIYGQKVITEDDYRLWSKIKQTYISPNANWVAWKQEYPNLHDSLFIKNTYNDSVIKFKDTEPIEFNKTDQKLLLRHLKDTKITLIEFNKFETKSFKNAVNAIFIHDDNFVLIEQLIDNKKHLSLYNIKTKNLEKLGYITEYKYNTGESYIAFINHSNEVFLTLFKKNKSETQKILNKTNNLRKSLTWSNTSHSLAFLEEIDEESYTQSKNHLIHYFENIQNSVNHKILDLADSKTIEKEFYIARIPNYSALQFSPDNQTIYFTVASKKYLQKNINDVQVWESQPSLKYLQEHSDDKTTKLVAWQVKNNITIPLFDKDFKSLKFFPNMKYALLYNENQYATNNALNSQSNIFLIDLKTFSKTKILEGFSTNKIQTGAVQISPNGKYLTYFLKDNWFIYNIKDNTHKNITKNIEIDTFTKLDKYQNTTPIPFENAVWTQQNTLLMQGKKFLWNLDPTKIDNRILLEYSNKFSELFIEKKYSKHTVFQHNNHIIQTDYVDLKNLILKLKKDFISGYFTLNKQNLTKISFQEQQVYNLKKAKNNNSYIYLSENTDEPTIINFFNGKYSKKIHQINAHQEMFLYPQKELISYTNSNNDTLKGVLFYPTDFDCNKQYPLIVHLYEKQTPIEFTEYKIPTLYNPGGFNLINYTSNGYFVFYPDIKYRIGNPGYSALDCTLAATNKVLTKKYINKKKTGLIGHSFGGYETAFIATQTNMFKVIVAGAALSDLPFHSLTIDKSGNISQTWRYIAYQMRMGVSLQENYQGYLDNSPIYHIDKLNTNLLSWSGGQDLSVDVEQSIALHFALKNINKKHTLLIYPNEGHILLKPNNQMNLYKSIKNHFDRFLK